MHFVRFVHSIFFSILSASNNEMLSSINIYRRRSMHIYYTIFFVYLNHLRVTLSAIKSCFDLLFTQFSFNQPNEQTLFIVRGPKSTESHKIKTNSKAKLKNKQKKRQNKNERKNQLKSYNTTMPATFYRVVCDNQFQLI